MTDALRTRLEGNLEVLEEAIGALEALDQALRSGWETRRDDVLVNLDAALRTLSRLDGARAAAGRIAEAAPYVAQLDDVSARLEQRIARELPPTNVNAARLARRLEIWRVVARHTGVAHEGEPLASAERVASSLPVHPLYVGLGAFVVLFVQRMPLVAAISLAIGALAWRLSLRRTRYRLFDDVLEVHTETRPVHAVPIASMDVGRTANATVIRGLRDVELPDDAAFTSLVDMLAALVESRDAIAREEQVLAKYAPIPALWFPAALQRDEHASTEHRGGLEIVHFASSGRVARGRALVTESGVLFLELDAEREARVAITGCPPFAFPRNRQVPFEQLPEQLIIDRLDELRALRRSAWIARGAPQTWESTDDRELVKSQGLRLTLTVDEGRRPRLHAWRSAIGHLSGTSRS